MLVFGFKFELIMIQTLYKLFIFIVLGMTNMYIQMAVLYTVAIWCV